MAGLQDPPLSKSPSFIMKLSFRSSLQAASASEAGCVSQMRKNEREAVWHGSSEGVSQASTLPAGERGPSEEEAAAPISRRQGVLGAACGLLLLTSTQLISTLNKDSNHHFQDA